MTDRTPRLLPLSDIDPGDRGEAQRTIYRAIALLREERQVQETVAYTILVMTSIEAGLTVRETARQLVDAHGRDATSLARLHPVLPRV